MRIPTPQPGLVIHYAFLWHHEHLEGREEARKDRPFAIVAAIQADEAGEIRALVLPITHSSPDNPSFAIEIPPSIKKLLRLDTERSWIVISEWNELIWPGPDLRPAPGVDPATITYGFLPPGFFNIVRARFLALAREGKARRVTRAD